MPTLNHKTPLHTFSSTLTYTTSKECYLYGQVTLSQKDGTYHNYGTYTIDGTTYRLEMNETDGVSKLNVPTTKLQSGIVVSVGQASPFLRILEEVN